MEEKYKKRINALTFLLIVAHIFIVFLSYQNNQLHTRTNKLEEKVIMLYHETHKVNSAINTLNIRLLREKMGE